jgi:hypothetical protein
LNFPGYQGQVLASLMSNLLQSLAENWHNPHPYWKYVDHVVPSSSYKFGIENILLSICNDEHYDFKLYKSTSKHTLFDNEIDRYEYLIKKLQEEKKHEEELFEKLCKKMEELQGEVPQTEITTNQEEEEEEEEEEVVDLAPQKTKGAQPKAKVSKESPRTTQANLKHQIMLAKSTKSSMATSQQKLMDITAELDLMESRLNLYREYQKIDLYRSAALRKFVLEYEKQKNLETLIRQLDELLQDYFAMRIRVAPKEPCSGEPKALCKSHHLPLYVLKYTEKGDPSVVQCTVYPPREN